MSVRYLQSGQADEAGFLATGGQIADDDDGGWSGLQRTFVGIALTAALAASALAAQTAQRLQRDPEEIPAHSLATGGQEDGNDESCWAGAEQCFASIALATNARITALEIDCAQGVQQDPEEIPAHTLAVFSTPDEDFWQNATPPVPPPTYRAQPYLPDPEELPAGALLKFSTPDEDFWTNPTPPIAPAVFQRLPYLADPEEIPAGSLYGCAEEDYWQNAVRPVPPPNVGGGLALPWGPQGVPLPEASDDPAGSLAKFGTPDEDLWGLGVRGQGLGIASGLAPNPQSLTPSPQTLYLPDVSDDPAGSFGGLPDEDFWNNPAQAVCRMWQMACRVNPTYDLSPATYQPLPYLPDLADDPAAAFARFATPDEDFWANGVAPVPPTILQPLPIAAAEPAEIAATVPPLDEDLWINPIAPAVGRSEAAPRPYLPDLGDDPAGSLHGQPDEDYWVSGVRCQVPGTTLNAAMNPLFPVPCSLFPLPYLPEPTDDPAGSLHGQPDEDYWVSGVPPLRLAAQVPGTTLNAAMNALFPVPCSLFPLPYLLDAEEVPAAALYGQPDEDVWKNAVAAVPPAIWQPLPIGVGESAEIVPQLVLPPDEGFWGNPAQTVCRMWQVAGRSNPTYDLPPTTYQTLPYLPDPTDDPAGSLHGQPDEDYWGLGAGAWGLGKPPTVGVNPQSLAPSPQTLYLPEPTDDPAGSLHGQPDEDYWIPGMPQAAGGIAPTCTMLPGAYRLWSDQADLPLVFSAEDDAWGNPIVPTRAAQLWIAVPVWETEPFASYWWITRWAVRTHAIARARLSRSLALARESRSAARGRVSRGICRQSSVVSSQ